MTKNTKRAMAAFINAAVVLPNHVLVEFLVSHGYAATWSLDNARAVADTIGAAAASAQLDALRAENTAKVTAERATKLAVAREAWVKGDARAFDGIWW